MQELVLYGTMQLTIPQNRIFLVSYVLLLLLGIRRHLICAKFWYTYYANLVTAFLRPDFKLKSDNMFVHSKDKAF